MLANDSRQTGCLLGVNSGQNQHLAAKMLPVYFLTELNFGLDCFSSAILKLGSNKNREKIGSATTHPNN